MRINSDIAKGTPLPFLGVVQHITVSEDLSYYHNAESINLFRKHER